jgi:hypothetical protein
MASSTKVQQHPVQQLMIGLAKQPYRNPLRFEVAFAGQSAE